MTAWSRCPLWVIFPVATSSDSWDAAPSPGWSPAAVAPAALHWRTPFLRPTAGFAVPAGHYRTLYLIGAASYGPVHFAITLRYRGAPAAAIAADWPDWWSPGNPLPAVIAGSAVRGGQVAHAVGLYAFACPLDQGTDLVGVRLPAQLPQQNGGQEAVHLVAATLARAGGGYLTVPLRFNADGLVPALSFQPPGGGSFDGYGYTFWSPHWPGASLTADVGGAEVPFALPPPRAGDNVLSDPAPAPPPWASSRHCSTAPRGSSASCCCSWRRWPRRAWAGPSRARPGWRRPAVGPCPRAGRAGDPRARRPLRLVPPWPAMGNATTFTPSTHCPARVCRRSGAGSWPPRASSAHEAVRGRPQAAGGDPASGRGATRGPQPYPAPSAATSH